MHLNAFLEKYKYKKVCLLPFNYMKVWWKHNCSWIFYTFKQIKKINMY